MDAENRHAIRRFILPVTAENIGTVLIGLVFSALIGGISTSALAAISTANLVINLYMSAFSLLSVGAAVLTARLVGARETADASRTVEQAVFMTIMLSALLTALSLILANPLMRLLMPTAEARLYAESVRYFRVISLSVPGLTMYTVLMSVLRASGNSRVSFYTVTIINVAQIIFAYLFIKVMPMDVLGAGLANVICRTIGGVIAIFVTLRSHSAFFVKPRNMLIPDFATIKRITRLGLPTSIESCFVQVGYIVANSMVVGLGTRQATIYQVATALQSFANLPLGIGSALATTFIGQRIGAKMYAEAKSFGYKVFFAGLAAILVLYVLIAALGPYLAPLYSSDPMVISGTLTALWVLIGFSAPGLSINVIDPALRAGGDVKFVLLETLVGVWLARLPLTWLLGYYFNMGVNGILIANIVSLFVRAVCGQVRYAHGKWLYKRV